MRIVWHSNSPLANTGYGQQTAIFAPRLKALGHDVSISAFWGLGGSAIHWDGIKVYPADENFGNINLAAIAAHEDADLVITLMDVWVLKSPKLAEVPLASWVPIDHAPAPPMVVDFFRQTGSRPIAMSKFGAEMLTDEGLDPLYVPHGIDTEIFQPRAREAAREAMGLGADDFLVGMNAFNKGTAPPRKAFPQVFQAFARFLKDRPTSKLYLHTEMTPRHQGLDLNRLIEAVGLPEDAVKTTRPWKYELGAEPVELSGLYSMLDVLACPSYGEGFGIPIIEAQACGTPVIVSDFSAMRELCGAGWKVDGELEWHEHQAAFWHNPSIDSIYRALHEAYDARHDEGLRKRAREFALQYDADRIVQEHWVPTLDRLNVPRLRSEPWLNDHFPREGRVALDIGANVGEFTAHLLAGYEEIHSFEPDSDALKSLSRFAAAPNVKLHTCAVGAGDGRLKLKTYEQGHAQTSALDPSELDTAARGESTGTISVPMRSIDSLGFDGKDVDFIKIDVEGYEVEVILGALKTLQANKPRLLVEIHSAENGKAAATLLGDLGYEIEPIPHPHPGVHPGHHWLDARVPA